MYSDKPLKVRVSITLDEDVIETLKYLSSDAFRPLSQYINLVLKRHIRDVEKNGRKTL